MKKILVPTDFGENSLTAIKLAHQISEMQEGSATLLHVINFPALDRSIAGQDYSEVTGQMEDMAKTRLAAMMDKVSAKKNFNIKVMTGTVLSTILQYAREENFDLMVLGAKHLNDVEAQLFGTFTDKLLHKSTLPVLVTRQDHDFSKVQKVLMGSALKLKNREIEKGIQTIRSLVSKASVEFIRINTPTDFMSQDVFDDRAEEIKKLPALKDCKFTAINFKNPAEGLVYYAVKSNANMIVIGDKSRSTFRRWLLGEDTAEQVMDFSNLPVLIL